MKYLLYLFLLILIFPDVSSTELAPYSKFAKDSLAIALADNKAALELISKI